MRSIRSLTIGTLTVCMIVLSGCAAGTRNPDTAMPTPGGNGVREWAAEPPASPAPDDQQSLADRLEQLAEGIPQVQRARCVVLGRMAIVGIDVPEGLERSRVDVIKYSVAEALRHDPAGVSALVTADLDLNQQLADLRDKARAGRPIAGFAEELADIIGRIVPQVPADIRQPQAAEQRTRGGEALPQR